MPHTEYNAQLTALVLRATSMHATAVGEFDPKNRKKSERLFAVNDLESLKSLAIALSVLEESAGARHYFMTPGDIQLNFLDGHAFLTSVVFLYPDFLRWEVAGPDARLQDGEQLTTWLIAQGWHAPVRPA